MTLVLPLNTKEKADRVDEIINFIKKVFKKHSPKFQYNDEFPSLTIHLFEISGLHGLDDLEKAIQEYLQTEYCYLAEVGVKIIRQGYAGNDSLNGNDNASAWFMCDIGKRAGE